MFSLLSFEYRSYIIYDCTTYREPLTCSKCSLRFPNYRFFLHAFGQFSIRIGNTDTGFVMSTGKTLLKVCPWFLLLPDKFLKLDLDNDRMELFSKILLLIK